MRLKRLVGRLCQTPGRWDAATPGAFHFRILDPAGKWFGTFSPD
jgi:hypothetical protein